MANKDFIRKTNRRLRQRLMKQDATARSYHSGSYHRYFEDYSETKVTDENGRTRIFRNYTGDWYTRDLEGRRSVLLKIAYVVLFLIYTAFLVNLALMARESDRMWYVAAPEFGMALMIFIYGYTLFVNYLPSPKVQTIGQYKASSGSTKVKALIMAGMAFLGCIGSLVYILIHPEFDRKDLLSIFNFLAAALAAGATWFTEYRLRYLKQKGALSTTGQQEEGSYTM